MITKEQQLIDNLKCVEKNMKKIIELLKEERDKIDKQLIIAKSRCNNDK